MAAKWSKRTLMGAVMAVILILAGGLPSAADPPESPPPTPASDEEGIRQEAEGTAKELGMTVDEVIAMTDWQGGFNEMTDQVQESYPDNYAGAAINDDGGTGTVHFTGTVPPEAEQLIKSFDRNVEVVAGRAYSEAEVARRLEKAYRAVMQSNGVLNGVAYADDKGTSLVITVQLADKGQDVSQAQRTLQATAIEKSGLPVNLTVTIKEVGNVEASMRGGGKLDLASGGPRCTAGFVVKSATSAVYGMSTASHCVSGSSLLFSNQGSSTKTKIYLYKRSTSRDVAWYNNGGTLTPTRQFNYDYNRFRAVTASANPKVGTIVSNFGRTSGYKGTGMKVWKQQICSTNYCGLTAINTYRTAGGDSGGPWFRAGKALGTHHGVMTIQGTQRSLFAPVTSLKSYLNVVVYK